MFVHIVNVFLASSHPVSKKAIKQQQIIDAAIQLLAEYGVGVPTAKIAAHAGASNGTLFNYFPTKQVLLDTVYLAIKAEVATFVIRDTTQNNEDARALFAHHWKQYIVWATTNPLKLKVSSLLKSSTLISEQATATVDETFSFIKAELAQAQATNLVKDMSTDLLCEIALAQMLAVIQHLYQHKLKDQEQDLLIKQSFDVYWDGITV